MDVVVWLQKPTKKIYASHRTKQHMYRLGEDTELDFEHTAWLLPNHFWKRETVELKYMTLCTFYKLLKNFRHGNKAIVFAEKNYRQSAPRLLRLSVLDHTDI